MDNITKCLAIVGKDAWLQPVEGALMERYMRYERALTHIESDGSTIIDYANGYLYYGFHYDPVDRGWWFREWLPGAKDVFLMGDFNSWQRTELPLKKGTDGVWTIFLPDESFGERIVHGSLVKMLIHGNNGWTERIPSYIRRVVQDEQTKDFTGQIWSPAQPFDWCGDSFALRREESLLIYEAHVGMAQEKEGVGSYDEFRVEVLPRIKAAGYNTIQLMAVAEHPYYGSFGYHVSNFYAPSSRFGTPEELKALVLDAHRMGIAVIMDLVHSHYVKNMNEGLNLLDGTDLYSPKGEAGDQPYWDSKLFDYARDGVQHFLLSNIKYWLDEFHFDGFRFDGVTSMIYRHHGYTEFDNRDKYFNDINDEALCYLTLANKLIHDFRPAAVTIAEDVSGMPGMCYPIEEGGVGFDYRLGMAVPDFWIKMLKEIPDEQWDIRKMWDMMTNRLADVKTIAYSESHDQALVGDQTLAFRLMNKSMYTDMDRVADNIVVDRGIALHKMIRLFTITLAGQAYLNFMGNEFGHPEWIDFPREGNHWSYAHARRQWSLATNGFLKYSYLWAFDRAMIGLVRKYNVLNSGYAYMHNMDDDNQTIVYSHANGRLLFVFNWSPSVAIADYVIPVPWPGRYKVVLSTDDKAFGGLGRIDDDVISFSFPVDCEDGVIRHYIKVYNLNRSALVFERMED